MRFGSVAYSNFFKTVLSAVAVYLTFVSCASAPVTATQPLALDSIEEIAVATGGVSIETDFMRVQFDGQVVYRPKGGEAQPLAHVRVYREDPKRGAPYPVRFTISRDGRFSEEVSLLVCRSAGNEWPHWPTFIFTAVGCEPKRVELGAAWQPGPIEMTCPRRK